MLTITTPATNFDLIALATAKTALKITDHSADDFLKDAIKQASDVIARYCRRVFAQETVCETLRLDHSQREIALERYPVTAISTVVENATTIDASEYELNAESGLLRRLAGDGSRNGHWPATRIVVNYTAGYDLPTRTPDGLKKAVTRLVQAYWHTADRDLSERSSDIPGVHSATYLDFEHMPFDAEGLLEPFCSTRIG